MQTTHDSGSVLESKDDRMFSRAISTSFNALRIRNIRSKRILDRRLPHSRWSGGDNDCTLMEEYEYFVSLPYIRCGILVSQQTRFGPIFPALRVYHIVNDIDDVIALMWNNGKQTFQEALNSGLVHPFTRDRHHRSLLHVGRIAHTRPSDECRLTISSSLQLKVAGLIGIACY